ncbi:MAG: NADH-quinone oxidoreductase subunit J [Fidelibacterota bacterium]|nr:MAG: NADH-quinone oxidoreductase subunit J [Candidatus Neomarinimicrobiota bacterium]
MTAILFYIFATFLLAASLFVVLNRNPIYSVVALVFAFMNLAAMYFLLEAYFIGILQVLVYAGAIMVLFLFVVMLLNVQPDQPRPGLIHFDRWWYGLMGLIFVGLFLVLIGEGARLLLTSPAGEAVQIGGVDSVGEALFTHFLLPFEIASLLLTVALVGTVFLAKRRV